MRGKLKTTPMLWVASVYILGMAVANILHRAFMGIPPWAVFTVFGGIALGLLAEDHRSKGKSGSWSYLAGICLICGFVRYTLGMYGVDPHAVQGSVPGTTNIIRTWLELGIDSTSLPAHAGYIKSILLGGRTSLSTGLSEDYARTGIAHILSVSGLHVAFVALALQLLLGRIIRKKWILAALQVLGIWLYSYACGSSPPVLRSAMMMSFACLGPVIDRRVDALTSVSLSAILSATIDPLSVTGISFQLSYAAVVSLLLLVPVLEYQGQGLIRRGNKLTESLTVSTAATIGTLPLTAMYFGRVSLVGPLMNIIAVPVSGFIVVMGLVQAVLGHGISKPLGQALGASNGLLIDALNASAHYAAIPAMAAVSLPAFGTLGILAAYATIAYTAWNLSPGIFPGSRRVGRSKALLVFGFLVAVWSVQSVIEGVTLSKAGAYITFINVGQGDSTLIRSGDGSSILVDCGPKSHIEGGWDAGLRMVLPALRKRGVKSLDAIILTHADLDHIGGTQSVLKGMKVGRVLTSPYKSDSPFMVELEGYMDRKRIPRGMIEAGDVLKLGKDIEITVLSPAGEDLEAAEFDASPVNASSVVVKVVGPGKSVLLDADADFNLEDRILARYGNGLDSDILKVGHHGSATSSASDFLDAVSPGIAVVSVGRNNRYGHPSAVALKRLEGSGAEIERTDLRGDITMGLK